MDRAANHHRPTHGHRGRGDDRRAFGHHADAGGGSSPTAEQSPHPTGQTAPHAADGALERGKETRSRNEQQRRRQERAEDHLMLAPCVATPGTTVV